MLSRHTRVDQRLPKKASTKDRAVSTVRAEMIRAHSSREQPTNAARKSTAALADRAPAVMFSEVPAATEAPAGVMVEAMGAGAAAPVAAAVAAPAAVVVALFAVALAAAVADAAVEALASTETPPAVTGGGDACTVPDAVTRADAPPVGSVGAGIGGSTQGRVWSSVGLHGFGHQSPAT